MECACGKTFFQINAFSNHRRHCKFSQQQLDLALSKAQKIWSKKRESKRQRKEASDGNNSHAKIVDWQATSLTGTSISTPMEAVLQSASLEPESDDNVAPIVCPYNY